MPKTLLFFNRKFIRIDDMRPRMFRLGYTLNLNQWDSLRFSEIHWIFTEFQRLSLFQIPSVDRPKWASVFYLARSVIAELDSVSGSRRQEVSGIRLSDRPVITCLICLSIRWAWWPKAATQDLWAMKCSLRNTAWSYFQTENFVEYFPNRSLEMRSFETSSLENKGKNIFFSLLNSPSRGQ